MRLSKNNSWPWLVCAILFVGFLTNSISSYMVSRNNVLNSLSESTLPLTSDNVYSEIQRDLLRPIFISSLMANDTFLRDWVLSGEKDSTLATKFLNEIKGEYGTVTSFFVSDKTKNYYHADGLLKEIKADDPRDEWYYNVKEISEPYEINVDFDMANKDEMTIFINYRVLDYEDQFIGVTGVGLTVSNVNHLISNYENKYDRQIYFVDSDGKIVLRPSNSPLFNYKNLVEIPGLEATTPALLQRQQKTASYQRDGSTHMLNCRYVSELNWFLIVEQSQGAMLEPIRAQLIFNLLLALLVTTIVAWICGSAIQRNHTRVEQRNIELTKTIHENERQKQELAESAAQVSAANERLSGLNKEKDEFISIVAHDLRNPLNGILGLCELAEHGGETPDIDFKSFVTDIQDCGKRMLNLTQALLDVSRIEEFHGDVTMDVVDCNAIIREMAAEFEDAAARKKITFNLILDSNETHPPVHSKPDWLSICVNNVISNAIKYTPIGGKVNVSSYFQADTIEIQIQDNGPGISDDDQLKMFGKFTRLSATPTANESSTGLGLYLVKKLCVRLSIDIRVDSSLGHGTRFTFNLPYHS